MVANWRTGFADGDRVRARHIRAGIGNHFDQTLAAPAASITAPVPGNPQGMGLFIYAYLRGTDVAKTANEVRMQINTDTTNKHYSIGYYVTGSTVAAISEILAGVSSCRVGICSGGGGAVSDYSFTKIWFPNYRIPTNGGQLCSWISRSTATPSGSTGWIIRETNGGVFTRERPITLVTLFPDTGNFETGSRVTAHVYGAPAGTIPRASEIF